MDWNLLPTEIIREHILPFTYSPQSIELCEDIRSFSYTTQLLNEKYKARYYNENDDYEDKEWLSNDIVLFLNENNGTMVTHTKNYIDVCKRLYLNQNKTSEQIIQWIKYLDKSKFPCDIHIYLGLLTAPERNALYNTVKHFL